MKTKIKPWRNQKNREELNKQTILKEKKENTKKPKKKPQRNQENRKPVKKPGKMITIEEKTKETKVQTENTNRKDENKIKLWRNQKIKKKRKEK